MRQVRPRLPDDRPRQSEGQATTRTAQGGKGSGGRQGSISLRPLGEEGMGRRVGAPSAYRCDSAFVGLNVPWLVLQPVRCHQAPPVVFRDILSDTIWP